MRKIDTRKKKKVTVVTARRRRLLKCPVEWHEMRHYQNENKMRTISCCVIVYYHHCAAFIYIQEGNQNRERKPSTFLFFFKREAVVCGVYVSDSSNKEQQPTKLAVSQEKRGNTEKRKERQKVETCNILKRSESQSTLSRPPSATPFWELSGRVAA